MKKKIVLILLTVVAGFIIIQSRNTTPPTTLGTVRVSVETYLAGKNQITHPSILSFPEKWKGVKYWLAYTPHPYANGEEENPSIAVSNDMIYWETPGGLANPIANNEETGCDELKDPHLVYREDLDRIEVWYLGRLSEKLGGDGKSLLLFRKYSYDGVVWSDYEVMTTTQYLSPTIIWDGKRYQMWGIGYDLWGTEGTIAYQESTDGKNWTEPIKCFLGDVCDDLDVWHGAITKNEGKYSFAFVDASMKQEIFFCDSLDGIHFTVPQAIVQNDNYWDFLYRPVLMYDQDGVICLYGVVNRANQWYISMSLGDDEYHLKGIDQTLTKKMYKLTDNVIDTHSIAYQLRCLYDAIQRYFRLELLACVIIELAILLLISERKNGNKYLGCSVLLNIMCSFVYIALRMKPTGIENWVGAIISIACLNIGGATVLICVQMHLNGEKKVEA